MSEEADCGVVPQLFSELRKAMCSELRKAMCSGDADQNGGCTDAAVCLANILKVGKRMPST